MGKSTASELVRGAGMAADVWTRLDQAVRVLGGVEDDLHLLARQEGQPMIDMIAGLLVRAGAAARNVYPVIGEYGDDYALTFASLLAEGDYGYKNPNITPVNFPGVCISGFDAVPVSFNREIGSDEAVREMDQMGLRPATMLELLAFGAKFPDIQRKFPIVELASSWVAPGGYRCVGVLDRWSDRRKVFLADWAYDWHAASRFLAVRKEESLAA